jgi:protein required for attachment to host cells
VPVLPRKRPGPAVILVADAARARLFDAPKPTSPLHEVEDLANPLARLHEGDLAADRPGVLKNQALEPRHSAFGGGGMKDHRTEEFAASVCERLSAVVRAEDAHRVYIVAEPSFLGLLRQRMEPALRKQVVDEIPKSITNRAPAEIRAVLPARL